MLSIIFLLFSILCNATEQDILFFEIVEGEFNYNYAGWLERKSIKKARVFSIDFEQFNILFQGQNMSDFQNNLLGH